MRRSKIRGPACVFDRPPADLDGTFPPYMATTPVWTLQKNLSLRGKLCRKHVKARRWHVRGMITGICNGKGAWHEIMLPNGTLAYYHQTEFRPWREDDGWGAADPAEPPVRRGVRKPCLVC